MTTENTVTTLLNATVHSTSGKRRGRQSHAISDAFNAVTEKPVLLTEHAAKFKVSEKVLRQAKRFDGHNVQAGKGRVRVTKVNRKNGDHGLYIYRVTDSK